MEYGDHRDFSNHERFLNMQTTSTLKVRQIRTLKWILALLPCGTGLLHDALLLSTQAWVLCAASALLSTQARMLCTASASTQHNAKGPKQPDCRQLHGMDSKVGIYKQSFCSLGNTRALLMENRAFDIFLLSFQT